MKPGRLMIACLGILALGACSREDPPPAAPSAPEADAAPVAQAPVEDILATADGRWLLVNYWAEWCEPCLQEIPEFHEFAAQNADRVLVVMVNYDGATGDDLAQRAQKAGISLPLLESDPAARLGAGPPQVLPTTLVVRPDGSLAEPLIGPQTLASLTAATEG